MPDDKRKPSKIPIEEKKTFVWIEHHRDLVELAATMPQTQLVNVCDREADFFELFDEQRKNPRVELLREMERNNHLNPASIIHNNPQNSLLNNDIISFS